jgi:molybdopterin/thiamine biosynthesis adenylyltransferase
LSDRLLAEIQKASLAATLPDQSACQFISVAGVEKIAEQFQISGRQVECAALEEGIVPERYARNLKTFTLKEQITLLESAVAVVGLGGLGGTVIELLARAGIGTLNLADGDVFEDHNLNRQLLSSRKLLGHSKAQAAAARVREVNPSISVQSHFGYLNPGNARQLIGRAQVVVDCLDNIETRFVVQGAALDLGIPFVSAAVGGISGHVTTILPGDAGLALIYGAREKIAGMKGAEATLGCLPHAVVMIGALECTEVFKILLQRPGILRNRMLVVDLNDGTFETLQLA